MSLMSSDVFISRFKVSAKSTLGHDFHGERMLLLVELNQLDKTVVTGGSLCEPLVSLSFCTDIFPGIQLPIIRPWCFDDSSIGKDLRNAGEALLRGEFLPG